MEGDNRQTSIKNTIITVFVLAMLASVGSIGYLVFSSWLDSARATTIKVTERINKDIYEHVCSFMLIPYNVNERNSRVLQAGVLDLRNAELRDKYFVGVLSACDNKIYSISYGTVNGEYYGARRNESGVIEIMRNDAGTGGYSWYYSVNEDFSAQELAVITGKFDPRDRDWYKAAVAAGAPTYSPIYKHFIMDDLTVSIGRPIYDGKGELQGVMGTHMLLSDIGDFLGETVYEYGGYALIVEKDTDSLIANSLDVANFTIQPDGTLKRFGITDVPHTDIKRAYEEYIPDPQPFFFYKSESGGLYFNVNEIRMEGVDWLVVSAIPDGPFMTDIANSANLSMMLVLASLALIIILYNFTVGRLLQPVGDLLVVANALSHGDLTKRVTVVRNDEIGSISESYNQVADKMQFLIENLEASVQQRTAELQLILDSAAEGIYGIDPEGKCTFCNNSCLQILGYSGQRELIGQNMHWQIHHSHRDGIPQPVDECKILTAIKNGVGADVDDEVFWRANGTPFDVEYHAYPQVKNGMIVGGVVTFLDITRRRKREREIEYLSRHDSLTGLYNRRYLEDSIVKIDTPENLPLSIIFADINGLKMTNDIFGHTSGDELIKRAAMILEQSCSAGGVIARVGGDEFVVLLPGTDQESTNKILATIRTKCSDTYVQEIKCSVSLGSSTKTRASQKFERILYNAENAMYRDKTINRATRSNDVIENMVKKLHLRSPREEQHSIMVSELCRQLGGVLNLPETETVKLTRAGYLHDIGKFTLEGEILSKDILTEDEREKMRQHAATGFRILNLFDETLDLAEYVYAHHERWDGTGYPRKLQGEQIPLISRIISIAETYERVLNRGHLPYEERQELAIKEIEENAGTQFDPHLAGLFINMVKGQFSLF